MEPIKIQVSVELNLSEDTKKFVCNLLTGKPEPAKSEPAKPAPAKPAPAKPEPAKPAPAKPEPESISVEDVRKALASKVADHRSEIKEKLEELGAPSVTKLEPAKYQEMLDFLNSLS